MPELPEVETVRRGLEPALVGRRFAGVTARRAGLRFPFPDDFAARLEGQAVEALRRRAKYLLADLSSGETLVMHLGMTGRFLVAAGGPARALGEFHYEHGGESAHDHVVFRMSDGTTVTYNDVRRFGFMDLVPRASVEASRHFAGMGVEPLDGGLDGAVVARLFRGRRTPLKAALLDQRLIAGLGNIYVCEALFRAGLHPEDSAGTLADEAGDPTPAAHRLAEVVRAVLAEAVEAGGSTLRDYARTDGSLGYFQHRFRVYDRAGEPCATPGCGEAVERIVQSGRSTFYCPACQPREAARARKPVAEREALG